MSPNRLVVRDLAIVVAAIATITTVALASSSRDVHDRPRPDVPVVASGPPSARLGARIYQRSCSGCHTNDGTTHDLAKFHVNATPKFYINGVVHPGAMPREELAKLVDARLAIAEHSGIPAAKYYDKAVLERGEKQFRSRLDPKP